MQTIFTHLVMGCARLGAVVEWLSYESLARLLNGAPNDLGKDGTRPVDEYNGELSERTIPAIARGIKGILESYTMPYRELMAYYQCALMEAETKFRVLNEELSIEYDRNPIETIKTRLKSADSIAEKLIRRGYAPTVDNIENHIFDVAGIRVICGLPSDIYALSNAFTSQDDITVVECKDYIANPKPSGYRSLHLIVETPIYLHAEKRLMKVEVQFRTISMDWWASLEHKIRYKKDVDIAPELASELVACADAAAQLDLRMERVQRAVYKGSGWGR